MFARTPPARARTAVYEYFSPEVAFLIPPHFEPYNYTCAHASAKWSIYWHMARAMKKKNERASEAQV